MVHGTPGCAGFGIQGTIIHLAVCRCLYDMVPCLPFSPSVNQVISGYHCRIHIRGLGRDCNRRTALTKFIDTSYIECIFCQVFQTLQGITVPLDIRNLLIFRCSTFLII